MSERTRFVVLVSPACRACAGALSAVRDFARGRPEVTVSAVDVLAPGWRPPAGYAGTPMVLLADSVVSYGTPSVRQLADALSQEDGTGERR